MNVAIKQALSPKAILIAAGGACLVYGALTASALLGGNAVLDKLEGKMAAQSIPFERAEIIEESPHSSAEMKAPNTDSVSNEDLTSAHSAKNEPLPPAPYDGLTEESSLGDLPIIGSNKLKPFDAYKKPFVLDVKKPAIGIGISGLGLSSTLSSRAMSVISPNVSLIVSPYGDDVASFQANMRAKGFETWITLPLQNNNFPEVDPGSLGILADGGLRFNQDNLRRVLSSAQGYAGVAIHSDSSFINAQPMLSGILSDVMIRGLGFLEMNANSDTTTEKLAINNRAFYAQSSIRQREESLEKTFQRLKKAASKQQSAIGIIDASPAMLENYKNEIVKAEKEGFQIAPLSALTESY